MRRNALKALKPYRQQAKPLIEEMIAQGRVPEELVPSIRDFFVSGAVTKWKMMGVFENVWEAVHPPEKDALEKGGIPDLTKKYHDAEGRDSAWRDVTADVGSGEVDLQKVFNTSAMVCAYAFTTIDTPEASEAKIFAGADDELAIWLNGKPVFNRGGSHGFEVDQNEVAVQLPPGSWPSAAALRDSWAATFPSRAGRARGRRSPSGYRRGSVTDRQRHSCSTRPPTPSGSRRAPSWRRRASPGPERGAWR
jgi:hypothetical protein